MGRGNSALYRARIKRRILTGPQPVARGRHSAHSGPAVSIWTPSAVRASRHSDGPGRQPLPLNGRAAFQAVYGEAVLSSADARATLCAVNIIAAARRFWAGGSSGAGFIGRLMLPVWANISRFRSDHRRRVLRCSCRNARLVETVVRSPMIRQRDPAIYPVPGRLGRRGIRWRPQQQDDIIGRACCLGMSTDAAQLVTLDSPDRAE